MRTVAELARGFRKPPREFAPVVFWFLNDDMERGELRRQLRLMHGAGVGTVTLHPRVGHTVPYLSEEWFAGIRFCVEVCAELGMRVWLYDEDNWPSGYAGGEVLRHYPEGHAKHLAWVQAPGEGDLVVAASERGIFVRRATPWHPAFSEGLYVDLLDRKVTETFIATTHQRYAEALGEHLGTTVTAVFTDEPGFYNHFYDCAPGTVVWTDDLPTEFQKRTGYDLLPHLPALFVDVEGAGQVRIDFYRVVSRLILERFYLPLKQWCHEHALELVGHINNEELLVDHARYNADFFTAMDGLDVPGMDVICPAGDYRRAPDSMVPKLTSSAAHLRGKCRAFSETYGATGWDLTPDEMERIADWLGVRGVTRLVLHAFYQSIDGFRYQESPPSLFFQSPHWPFIPALVQYLTRWSWVLEQTRPCAQVAVYYPIDAVRAATSPHVGPSQPQGLDEEASEAGRLGREFRQLLDALFRNQVDFEVVDDAALASGSLGNGCLRVGDLSFRCLVIPPGGTSEQVQPVVQAAASAGVQVLSGTSAQVLREAKQWAVAELSPPSPHITITRRRARDADLFLIVNEGAEPYEGTLTLPVQGTLTSWDWGVGQIDPLAAQVGPNGTSLRLHLLNGSAACLVAT